MSRKPHYTPGESRLKKCRDCGEWLPLDEYQKSGTASNGRTQYRAYCKACYKMTATVPLNSPCFQGCRHLKYCRSILWTYKALPCEKKETYTVPCRRCGTEFIPKNSAHLYCGKECKNDARNERKREEYHGRTIEA